MTTVYESIRGKLHGTTEQTLWSEEIAQRIAAEDGLGELTEAHWKVIHTLRQHFVQYGALPPKELACGINSLESRCVDELFNSSHKAWHVAGVVLMSYSTAAIRHGMWRVCLPPALR